MGTHRQRNLIPPIYAVLIVAGFLIGGATAGIVVLIVGGAAGGLLWASLGRGGPAPSEESREDRIAARAARRAERR